MKEVNINIEQIFPFFFGRSGRNCGLFPRQLKESQLLLPPVPVVALLDWTGVQKELLVRTACSSADDM